MCIEKYEMKQWENSLNSKRRDSRRIIVDHCIGKADLIFANIRDNTNNFPKLRWRQLNLKSSILASHRDTFKSIYYPASWLELFKHSIFEYQ